MVRPLTKRKSDGDLYVRPPKVERQIDEILSQDQTTLRRRLTVGNPDSSDYLSSESLVYIARDFRRDGSRMINAVLHVLLDRCEAILLAKISNKELREEVLGQFGELFATDGTQQNRDSLDYFECRFNQAFRTFYIDLGRSETARLNPLAPLPDQADATEPNPPARFTEPLQSPETADSDLLLRELCEAIDALPDDECQAVILCHVMGYKIESNNPNEKTVATICNVSGRTIRNRLSRAKAKLSIFKEE